jgi:hypothetical protein
MFYMCVNHLSEWEEWLSQVASAENSFRRLKLSLYTISCLRLVLAVSEWHVVSGTAHRVVVDLLSATLSSAWV